MSQVSKKGIPHTTVSVSEKPTPKQHEEFWRQIRTGVANKDNFQSYLRTKKAVEDNEGESTARRVERIYVLLKQLYPEHRSELIDLLEPCCGPFQILYEVIGKSKWPDFRQKVSDVVFWQTVNRVDALCLGENQMLKDHSYGQGYRSLSKMLYRPTALEQVIKHHEQLDPQLFKKASDVIHISGLYDHIESQYLLTPERKYNLIKHPEVEVLTGTFVSLLRLSMIFLTVGDKARVRSFRKMLDWQLSSGAPLIHVLSNGTAYVLCAPPIL